MSHPENSYGFEKRFLYIKSLIEQNAPRSILDFGCGSGDFLTKRLAETFPNIEFQAVDSDKDSIEYAKRKNILPNVTFVYYREFNLDNKYDLIIASEVIEHVEEPGEFLLFLKERLNDFGKLVLTVPNGYGPFEFMSFVFILLEKLGIYKRLRIIKRKLFGFSTVSYEIDTLANSPHINFFSYHDITSLISDAGFIILEYRPRTFLCGFGFDQLLRSQKLLSWNAQVAEYLPPFLNSGWMFVIKKRDGHEVHKPGYTHNIYNRFRKYLNETNSNKLNIKPLKR